MFKQSVKKRKAFTLIELLIVIAIIGILFIVLVSKVDFATDKAKATGVQTDFRSFQLAFETVSRENAGFNTFGWDTGDLNANGKKDVYDEGDNGAGGGTAKNGIQDGTEVFTGHKVPGETFTGVFTLVKPGTDFATVGYDTNAIAKLETAINANLDPKLHITIGTDGIITMANGAQDPWNKEYHGWYITNAETDKKDRGAIVMYSDGANNEFGSEHTIANGVVSISIPGNNKYGKDDYSVAVIYTYMNGYGEVKTTTSGFSNNQSNGSNGNGESNIPNDTPTDETPGLDGDGFTQPPDIDLGEESDNYAGITLQTPYVLSQGNAIFDYEVAVVFYEDSWTFFMNGTHGVDESSIRPMGKAEYYDNQIKLYTAMGIDDYYCELTVVDVNEDGSISSPWGTLTKNSTPNFAIPTYAEIGEREPVGLGLAEDYTTSYSKPNLMIGDGYNGNVVYYPYNREVVGNKYPISNGRVIVNNETIRANWVDSDMAQRHKEFSIEFNSNDGSLNDIMELHTSVGHIFYDNSHLSENRILPSMSFPGMQSLEQYNGFYLMNISCMMEQLQDSLTDDDIAYWNPNYFDDFMNSFNSGNYKVIPSAMGFYIENNTLTWVVGSYWKEYNTFIQHELGDSMDLIDTLFLTLDNGDKLITLDHEKLVSRVLQSDGTIYFEQFDKTNVNIIDGYTIDEYIPVMLNEVMFIDQEGCIIAKDYTILTNVPRVTSNGDGSYHFDFSFEDAGWYPDNPSSSDGGYFGDYELWYIYPSLDFAQYMEALTNHNYDYSQMTGIYFIPAIFVD